MTQGIPIRIEVLVHPRLSRTQLSLMRQMQDQERLKHVFGEGMFLNRADKDRSHLLELGFIKEVRPQSDLFVLSPAGVRFLQP